MTAAFGDILREWRSIRRFSQLDLSLEAATSARHVSFLESGRASPSRNMVLKLSEALSMPKEIANQALTAAGFAPIFPQLPPDDANLQPVKDAVRMMLENHDPYPGIAIDRHWDIIDINQSAIAMFSAFEITGAGNMMDAIGAIGDSDIIENWEEVALLAIARLRTEAAQIGGDRILERYAAQLGAHPRLKNYDVGDIDYSRAVIPSVVNIGDKRLSLFTTIAQFGTVQDIAASDIRVELMFPSDAATRAHFESASNN